MTADALLTRVAVALHGVTPPDPEGALALYGDAAARVVAALGDVEGLLREHWFHDGGDICECGYWAHLDCVKRHHIEDAALTTEPTP